MYPQGVQAQHSLIRPACAGQAIVQMAQHKASRLEYAIKFFIARSAFLQEKDLYTGDSPLGQFLPQVCTEATRTSMLCLPIL